MLTTFTTEHGLLVIRAEDLRRIQDMGKEGKCTITWIEGDEPHGRDILGTAQENLDRILEAETKALATYEAMQRRQSQGLPVVRGGKVAP